MLFNGILLLFGFFYVSLGNDCSFVGQPQQALPSA